MSLTYVISAVRTPVGRYGGALASVRPDDLAALTIRSALERSGANQEDVDEVILGNANGAGEENRNVARMAAMLAGLPLHVPGMTLNRLCASGMSAITSGHHMISAGEADLVVAGGVESMTRAPWVQEKPATAWARPGAAFDTSIGWRFTNPQFLGGPLSRDGKMTYSMPETAEEVARRFDTSREDCDAFALESHRRAVAAQEAGHFTDETVPVPVADRKGNVTTVVDDEGPRPDTSIDQLARLRPVVRGGSVVTAGNSSSLNDGASAVVLASERMVERLGVEPLARIVGGVSIGLEPEIMGMGPVRATEKLLARHGVTVDQVDSVELNEAFASQSLASIRELGLDPAVVNPDGGAIALGHPLGSSGSRLVVTLTHRLRRDGGGAGRLGLATMCVGVGQGAALLIETV
nr:acetyl-CoA C-acyltransferase [Actinomycetales bacterium]